jgi:hypothetical protein
MNSMFEGLPSNFQLTTVLPPVLTPANLMEQRLQQKIAKVLEESSASEYCDGVSSGFVESSSSEHSDCEDVAGSYVY